MRTAYGEPWITYRIGGDGDDAIALSIKSSNDGSYEEILYSTDLENVGDAQEEVLFRIRECVNACVNIREPSDALPKALKRIEVALALAGSTHICADIGMLIRDELETAKGLLLGSHT